MINPIAFDELKYNSPEEKYIASQDVDDDEYAYFLDLIENYDPYFQEIGCIKRLLTLDPSKGL